jgi:hypothetical protein
MRREHRAHAIESPEQVDRRWATRREDVERRLQRGIESCPRSIVMPERFERYAEGGSATDRGRAAHDHGTDGIGDFGRAGTTYVFETGREDALVDQL